MSENPLACQARRCAEQIGMNEYMCSITTAVWTAFEGFLTPGWTRPMQLSDADVQMVERFIATRAKACTDVEALLLEITCIRLTLLASGLRHRQLAALSVRVKRERLPNDANGKYRFARTLALPGP